MSTSLSLHSTSLDPPVRIRSNNEKYPVLKRELYEIAQRLDIDGRSTMTKRELEHAVFSHPDVRKDELYAKAREIDLAGRSTMTKAELRRALVGPDLTPDDYNENGQPVLYRVIYDDEQLGYCTARHRPGIYTMLFFHGPDLTRSAASETDRNRMNNILPVAPDDAVILDPPK